MIRSHHFLHAFLCRNNIVVVTPPDKVLKKCHLFLLPHTFHVIVVANSRGGHYHQPKFFQRLLLIKFTTQEICEVPKCDLSTYQRNNHKGEGTLRPICLVSLSIHKAKILCSHFSCKL